MINAVINKIDELYPFTTKSLGYVVKKVINDIQYPCKLINNEYKQLIDFQTLYDFHYWYLTGDITAEENKLNLYSNKRTYTLTHPFRIFICRKDICEENLPLNFLKQIDNLSLSVKQTLNIQNFTFQVNSYNLLRDEIFEEEFGIIPKLTNAYAIASIDVNLLITVDKNCLDTIC